ncbi:MAG: leucyl aminopeptidase [Acidobacteriota bacterium]
MGTSVVLEARISSLRAVETDTLVIPVFEDDELADLPELSHGGDEIGRVRSSREFTGALYDVYYVPLNGWQARRALLVGAGRQEAWDIERLRRAATTAALSLRARRIERAAFVVRGELEPGTQATAEGITLAEFSAAFYKNIQTDTALPRELRLVAVGGDSTRMAQALNRGRVIGESGNIARGLCNEPGNVLTPRVFADRAARIAAEAGLRVEVLDEQRIAERKMGLLLGVAQASIEPPRVIILRHEPPEAPGRPVLGLVGKGVTFDTGGISIKPADGMDRMKDDMAGGAAVLGAMRAMSLLKAPVRVVGVIPSAENMPGGRAYKPGDVLTGASGKTVEINNTDAEGRLLLGDGLWLAQQLGATHLVDVATLTGACVVALGKIMSGLFGTPDTWVQHVLKLSRRAGERYWHMPLHDDYLDQLKSEIADLVNSGGRPGGSVTAAMFLREFTNGLPWAHMDIAGTAWAEDSKPFQPKGATGVAVRTLTELAFSAFPV